jgi:hypothetical protein
MITTPPQTAASGSFWSMRRETSLNWLALGMLLAAWNASDNEAAPKAQPRPGALRGYASVSVRAMCRVTGPSQNCNPSSF